MKKFVVLAALVGTAQSFAAPFQNLGFDDANTNAVVIIANGLETFGVGSASDLLPRAR